MSELDAKLVAALERAGQALRVQLWDAAKLRSLNPVQVQVLLRLAGAPPPRPRVGALAAELDVSQPSMSDTVAALRAKALVKPGRELALTARGRAVALELAAWAERTEQVLARLPEDDKERTLRLLLELIAGLQRSGAITVARMCSTCRFFRPDAHRGQTRRHHCALLDMPLNDGDLRANCPEHELRAA